MKYIYKMNAKLPPINRRRLRKKEQIKEEKSRKIFLRPMVIVMIGSYNFIGAIFNG